MTKIAHYANMVIVLIKENVIRLFQLLMIYFVLSNKQTKFVKFVHQVLWLISMGNAFKKKNKENH